MKTKQTGTIDRHIFALTAIILAVATLTGCFWTPKEAKDGGITIDINTGAMEASAVQDFDGFFLGYVIADDLLRGDQATAEQAFAEVDVALQQALAFDTATFDENDFSVEISFPSIQLQADLFTGASGSNSFQGLRADAEYLVIVIAREWTFSTAGVDYTDGVGFSTTTISAGENTSVSLDVSEANWAELDTFLQGRYGVDADLQPEPAPELGPLTIDIAAISGVTAPAVGVTPVSAIAETDQYTGTVSWSPTPDGGDFDYGTVYTATITLTAKDGYTLTGVPADFFTVAGATVTHPANSGVVTAEFSATALEPGPVLEEIMISALAEFPVQFYYEFIDASTYSAPGVEGVEYLPWYQSLDVVNESGDALGDTGNRKPLPVGFTSETFAVVPDRSWRLLIATWEDRGQATELGNKRFYISTEITTSPGAAVTRNLLDVNGSGSPVQIVLDSTDFQGFKLQFSTSYSVYWASQDSYLPDLPVS